MAAMRVLEVPAGFLEYGLFSKEITVHFQRFCSYIGTTDHTYLQVGIGDDH